MLSTAISPSLPQAYAAPVKVNKSHNPPVFFSGNSFNMDENQERLPELNPSFLRDVTVTTINLEYTEGKKVRFKIKTDKELPVDDLRSVLLQQIVDFRRSYPDKAENFDAMVSDPNFCFYVIDSRSDHPDLVEVGYTSAKMGGTSVDYKYNHFVFLEPAEGLFKKNRPQKNQKRFQSVLEGLMFGLRGQLK